MLRSYVRVCWAACSPATRTKPDFQTGEILDWTKKETWAACLRSLFPYRLNLYRGDKSASQLQLLGMARFLWKVNAILSRHIYAKCRVNTSDLSMVIGSARNLFLTTHLFAGSMGILRKVIIKEFLLPSTSLFLSRSWRYNVKGMVMWQ